MIDAALTLRLEYQACIRLADGTDSKREDRQLREDAKALLAELRKTCPHDHVVILNSEYEGSYTMDYDDHRPGSRICLCCGVEETAWGGQFKTLRTMPIRRYESDTPAGVREPLKYGLADVTEIAMQRGYTVRR